MLYPLRTIRIRNPYLDSPWLRMVSFYSHAYSATPYLSPHKNLMTGRSQKRHGRVSYLDEVEWHYQHYIYGWEFSQTAAIWDAVQQADADESCTSPDWPNASTRICSSIDGPGCYQAAWILSTGCIRMSVMMVFAGSAQCAGEDADINSRANAIPG